MVLDTLEIHYDSDQLTQRDGQRLLSRVIPPRLPVKHEAWRDTRLPSTTPKVAWPTITPSRTATTRW